MKQQIKKTSESSYVAPFKFCLTKTEILSNPNTI